MQVTQREFYAYHLQYRPNDGSHLHKYGLLFQEFCVDAYCQIEQNRLNWVIANQD